MSELHDVYARLQSRSETPMISIHNTLLRAFRIRNIKSNVQPFGNRKITDGLMQRNEFGLNFIARACEKELA
jgi:hypothetical protein